jgi:PS-10 peptidase S37
MRRLSVALCLVGLVGCGVGAPEEEAGVRRQALVDPLLEQLTALPGVSVTEVASRPGARGFVLSFTQAVDHFNPSAGQFQQRALLLHRDVASPMVISTTGYGLFSLRPRDNEVSAVLGGNSLIVEHRFFGPSTPASNDPRTLNIRQAAWDHHRIIELLKPIYSAKWLSTGASKGGMTSLYHRRFFPNDVEGTIAYVAPQSYGTNDPRYPLFLEQVGTPACRQAIITFQQALLDRRAELTALYQVQAQDFGLTYQQVGGLDVAFEHAVQEFRFAFWQYSGEFNCAAIPAANAPAEALANMLDSLSGPADLASDQALADFGAYYYQAATQLGSYGPLELHLRSRLNFPGTYRVERYSPYPPARFDALAMPLVQAWVGLFGQRVMFLYGQNDPWSAGAFEVGHAQDSFRYVVEAGNHGSFLFMLSDAQRTEAYATLARWAGLEPQPAALRTAAPTAPSEAQTQEWLIDRQRHRLAR